MNRILLCCILIFGFRASPAAEQADTAGAIAVWESFLSSLRRGDYEGAYRRFSPSSRSVLTYDNFLVEYGPISQALEMLLAPPGNMRVQTAGDWAEVRFSALVNDKPTRVSAALTREDGAWSLVSGQREDAERVEAEARGVLRQLAAIVGQPNATEELGRLSKESSPVLTVYTLQADHGVIRAIPKSPGVRPFHVNRAGVVTAGMGEQGKPIDTPSSGRIEPLPASQGVLAPLSPMPDKASASPRRLPDNEPVPLLVNEPNGDWLDPASGRSIQADRPAAIMGDIELSDWEDPGSLTPPELPGMDPQRSLEQPIQPETVRPLPSVPNRPADNDSNVNLPMRISG